MYDNYNAYMEAHHSKRTYLKTEPITSVNTYWYSGLETTVLLLQLEKNVLVLYFQYVIYTNQ